MKTKGVYLCIKNRTSPPTDALTLIYKTICTNKTQQVALTDVVFRAAGWRHTDVLFAELNPVAPPATSKQTSRMNRMS